MRNRTQEMLGLIKGIVCDGVIVEDEVRAFRRWLQMNPDLTVVWPGRDLARRIVGIFEDGAVTKDEQHELYEMFCDTVGDGGPNLSGRIFPTRQPLDDPPPTVIFDGKCFCFTGTFLYGIRRQCELAVETRGGKCVRNVSPQVDYLVIGAHATDSWAEGSWGQKVESGVELRERYNEIHIIGEQHWADALEIDSP